MSPRPRKASDTEVFAAAGRVMSRLGPAELTLADIAAEAGLTAGALVQRFGSKRALLLALTARGAAAARDLFAELRTTHPSPLAAVRAYADCFAQMAATPMAVARNLAYLLIDLTDAEFKSHVMAQARVTRSALRALLDQAVQARQLTRTTDTAALARTIEVTLSGSLMTWAFYARGKAAKWIRDDLELAIRPYLTARERAAAEGRTVRQR